MPDTKLSAPLFWTYVSICALFLALNAVDVLMARQQADPTALIEEKHRDFPFAVSMEWAIHEVLRIRRFSGWFALHTVPVFLWLPLSVAQMAPSFRKNNLERHRRGGILLLATSGVMAWGVVMLLVRREEIYGTRFDPLSNPFTFSSWTVVAIAWWAYCAIQGYRYRPRKGTGDLRHHRRYMCHFLANGYSTGTSRLLNLAYMLWLHPKNGSTAMETAEFDRATDLAVWASLIISFVGAELWILVQSQADGTTTKDTVKLE